MTFFLSGEEEDTLTEASHAKIHTHSEQSVELMGNF